MPDSLRWLVIGVGDITIKRVLPAIEEHPRSTLHAILTRDPAKAAPYGCTVYTELDDALDDRAIDAVYVATPVSLHAIQTQAALRAKKHVLCEKPMAMNYDEAMDMVCSARDARRLFGVAYYRRHYPKLQRAKQLIESGAIGTPVLCEANCHSWYPPESTDGRWRLDPELAGGGPLYDIASHRIDAMNFLFGRPVRATGLRSNAVHEYPVEDNASILIDYSNGVRGYIDVRWNSQIPRDEFRIIGTTGELVLSPLNSPTLVTPSGVEQHPPHANLHYPLVAHFAEAALDGKPLLSSGETALWTDWVTSQVA